MGRRISGIVQCAFLLLFDAVVLYSVCGNWKITVLIMMGLAWAALWGVEIVLPLRYGAIRMDKLDAMTKSRMKAGVDPLLEKYSQYVGKKKHIQVYLLPDDCEFNAYAFGSHKIGITLEAINALDGNGIAAVLAHELGHVLALDACVKWILLMNGFVVLSLAGIYVLAWNIVILLFCVFVAWLLGSCMGMWIGIGLFKCFRKIGDGIIRVALCMGQVLFAVLERGREYRADAFAAELGYGYQLSYILDRFAGETKPAKSLGDMLYATHPQTKRRIARLEKRMQQESRQVAVRRRE